MTKKFLFSTLTLLMVLLLCIGCATAPIDDGTVSSELTESSEESSKETPKNNDDTPSTPTGNENPPEPQGTPAEESYLNGVELSKFSIVYPKRGNDYTKRAAEYIQAEILERTELELPLVTDLQSGSNEYQIIVGETGLGISKRLDADTQRSEFAILAEKKQIALEGDYFVIAAAAYFFIETYIPEDNFSAEIPKEVSIHEPIVKEAKNYIMLIGDGMGLYQTLLFDVMNTDPDCRGDGEKLFYGYYLPMQGMARTTSLSGLTDSAAAGTALATGYKTKNGYVGQDGNHKEIQSITELAASRGMSTAVMSTEASTGATPASFSAHANSRGDSADILADQAALTQKYGTIIECNFNNYYDSYVNDVIEPKILNVLSELEKNENGFFIMYEEAHIDKHCHSNDFVRTFRALVRFNQAIARFMEYAFYHPETFVLITADHETGELLPNNSGGYSFNYNDHSSYYVPVCAFGDGSELFDARIVENVQIPKTIARFMGVNNFGDQSSFPALKK
ncbi:MAG: alkaline phosphatase [Clostridia bacterium]|nr:alkaline phosphatase [Clostridia bacterium]